MARHVVTPRKKSTSSHARQPFASRKRRRSARRPSGPKSRSTLDAHQHARAFDARLLRRPIAAQYLGISAAALDLLRQRGDITPVPLPSDRCPTGLSTAVAYDRNDLDAVVERWKGSLVK